MKEEAIQYIKSQMARGVDRLHPYAKEGTKLYPRRFGFFKIEKYIKDFLSGKKESRWVIIPGLRGVGKTTILAQIFFSFRSKLKAMGVSFDNIIYISIDDVITAGLELNDVLIAYESVLNVTFESNRDPIIILIDEVQQDNKWASVLKSMYDKARNVFVVCTGSSAVQLQTNADVARRGIFEKLYPLNFSEYQMLKNGKYPVTGLKQKIKEAIYDSASAEEVFNNLKKLEPIVLSQWKDFNTDNFDEFLSTGTLPFTLRAQKSVLYERIDLLIDRMINKDIQELGKFDSQTLGIIKKLLFIMADCLDGFSVNKIRTILNIDRNTLSSILEALEKAEIIIRIPPYGSNITAVKKPSKYLFMTPAVRMSLLSITGLDGTFLVRRGKLLEDIAGLHFYREFVSNGVGAIAYDSAEAGADFILQISNKKQLAIEIGMGEKSYEQVKNTIAKIKCDYGLVICSSDSIVLSREKNIVKIPHQYFLLM